MTLVKVCGLTTSEAVDAAVEAGADYFGLMLFSRSPRAVTVDDASRLIERAGGRIRTVAVLVDPDDALADAVAALSPDLIQLHGRETPERMAAVRARTGLPVIKALPVGAPEDVAAAGPYTADHFMFDAKPPAGADRLGGHGAVFDWSILSSRPSPARDDGASDALWFLAGGLTPDNVAEAIRITGAPAVDVSSGVESAPGVKDPALIAAFVRAAKAATP